MTTSRRFALATLLLATAALPAAHAADYVYVGANDPTPGHNGVLGYSVAADGKLSPLPGSPFATGGTGYFDSSFKLGPFDNDQELVSAAGQQALFAVNGGSNTIAGFYVARNGALQPLQGWPVSSRGDTPVSIGVEQNALVVVNNASNPLKPGQPNVATIGIGLGGVPVTVSGAPLTLTSGVFPTQALTEAGIPYVFGSTFPNAPSVDVYRWGFKGKITLAQSLTPPVVGGTQSAPLGLWTSPKSLYLYVGLPNVSKLAIYRKTPAGLTYVGTADNSGMALCWVRGTKDGRFLLTANTGDSSISVYTLADPAAPKEIAHVQSGGQGGVQQFALDSSERHIYALQPENSAASAGHANRIVGFDFDPKTGALTAAPRLDVQLPLGANIRPAGLVTVHRD